MSIKKLTITEARKLVGSRKDYYADQDSIPVAEGYSRKRVEEISLKMGVSPDIIEAAIVSELENSSLKDHVLSYTFRENGQNMTRHHCSACGHSWTTNGYNESLCHCPNCGTTVEPSGVVYKKISYVRDFNPEKEFAVITTVMYRVEWLPLTGGEQYGDCDLRKKGTRIILLGCADSVFGTRFGFLLNQILLSGYFCSQLNKLVGYNNSCFCKIMDNVVKGGFVPNGLSDSLLKLVCGSSLHRNQTLHVLRDEDARIRKQNMAKKKNRTPRTLEDKYPGFCDPITDDMVYRHLSEKGEDILFFRTLNKKGQDDWQSEGKCLCGGRFVIDVNSMEVPFTVTCPECGAKTEVTHLNMLKNEARYQQCTHYSFRLLPDRNILVMIRESRISFRDDKDDLVVRGDHEALLITDKARDSITRYCLRKGVWKKAGLNNKYRFPLYTGCMNTDEELKEIINSSCLDRKGILEAWGLADGYDDRPFDKPGSISYLEKVLKYPWLEKLVKGKLYTMADDMSPHWEHRQ